MAILTVSSKANPLNPHSALPPNMQTNNTMTTNQTTWGHFCTLWTSGCLWRFNVLLRDVFVTIVVTLDNTLQKRFVRI